MGASSTNKRSVSGDLISCSNNFVCTGSGVSGEHVVPVMGIMGKTGNF